MQVNGPLAEMDNIFVFPHDPLTTKSKQRTGRRKTAENTDFFFRD